MILRRKKEKKNDVEIHYNKVSRDILDILKDSGVNEFHFWELFSIKAFKNHSLIVDPFEMSEMTSFGSYTFFRYINYSRRSWATLHPRDVDHFAEMIDKNAPIGMDRLEAFERIRTAIMSLNDYLNEGDNLDIPNFSKTEIFIRFFYFVRDQLKKKYNRVVSNMTKKTITLPDEKVNIMFRTFSKRKQLELESQNDFLYIHVPETFSLDDLKDSFFESEFFSLIKSRTLTELFLEEDKSFLDYNFVLEIQKSFACSKEEAEDIYISGRHVEYPNRLIPYIKGTSIYLTDKGWVLVDPDRKGKSHILFIAYSFEELKEKTTSLYNERKSKKQI